MKVLEVGPKLIVQLFSTKPKEGVSGATDDVLFAEAPIDLKSNPASIMESFSVPVIDSSRYFAIRCEDPKTGRHVWLGVGFRDRSDATDYKSVLQDYKRGVEREREAEARKTAGIGEGEGLGELLGDLSLKDGEKICIKIGGVEGGRRKKKNTEGGEGGAINKTGGFGLLRPPPKAGEIVGAKVGEGEKEKGEGEGGEEDDEDWGDFEGF